MSRNPSPINTLANSLQKLPFFGAPRPNSASEAQLYLQRALHAADEERFDVALVFCGKALEVAPTNIPARFLAAQLYEHVLRDVDRAVEAYRKVIVLSGYETANPYVAAAREALDALVMASTASTPPTAP
jgi:tetratricopeptide (TPR) repeat protein